MTEDLGLACWRAGDDTPLEEPAVYRAMEALLGDVVAPALAHPVVREHALAHVVAKDRGAGTVTAGIVAPPGVLEVVVAACRSLGSPLPPEAVPENLVGLLHPAAAEYRRGVSDVTDIALELHGTSHVAFRSHQCALVDMACGHRDPRYALHPYLRRHSSVYAVRAGLESAGGGWSWAHEQWWARCYTPGPVPGLGPPLLILWNVVLGKIPRRWEAPANVASRLGLRCP